jgi:Ca2+-binding RTX toxin-like protein
MRRFLVRFIRPESLVHNPSSAGFTITTSGFEFSVHTGSAQTNIVGRDDLINDVLSVYSGGLAGTQFVNDIHSGMNWLWKTNDTRIFDQAVFANTNDALTKTLSDRATTSSQVTLFVAGGSNDKITGSHDNDFIYGGKGDDELWGGGGSDLLAGGDDNDILHASAKDDILHTPASHDYLAGR